MPRGGYRPGSGRKSKEKKELPEPAKYADSKPIAPANVDGSQPVSLGAGGRSMPLEFMLAVMNDPAVDPDMRARMAVAAAPYCHTKLGEKGKKEQARDDAGKVASGRFGPAAPPKLVAVK